MSPSSKAGSVLLIPLLWLTACTGDSQPTPSDSREPADTGHSEAVATSSASSVSSRAGTPTSRDAIIASSSSVAGSPVADNPVAGNPVAGNPVAGNPVTGEAAFQTHCNQCHVDQHNGQFNKGLFAFNVATFTYPQMSQYSDYSAADADSLARFIGDNMATTESCNSACATDIAAYLWHYRDDSAPREYAVRRAQFDDTGLQLELSCRSGTELRIGISDPEAPEPSSLARFQAVQADAGTLSNIELQSVVNNTAEGFQLLGSGADIWLDRLYFTGLTRTLSTDNWEIALDVLDVEGVSHDFAKVGLLVSSTADLSGELLFVHWSGRQGLAEDSGLGELVEYHQLATNPGAEGSQTPVPATLRLAHGNDGLQLGACYDCSSPALQYPSYAAFEPQSVFVVASAHAGGSIEAELRLRETPAGSTSAIVHQDTLNCVDGTATIDLPAASLGTAQRLDLQIHSEETLVVAETLARQFDATASCAEQDALLQPQLRRLSQAQIANSLRDIFGELFADDIWPVMGDGAKLIGMNTLADRLQVNNLNLERHYDASRQIVQTLLSRHSAIRDCAQTAERACVHSLIDHYGVRVWRRPLSAAERRSLTEGIEAFATNAEALEFGLNALILSSNFLYRSEQGERTGGVRRLGNFELVSLLSYSLWSSTPDDTLLSLARQRSPLSREQLQTQATRLMADPRAERALMAIFKDFLKLELVRTRPKAEAFDFTPRVRDALLRSAEQMLLANIDWQRAYMSVFGGSEFFVNATTAAFFNRSDSGSQLRPVGLNSQQRYGLLNHPAFLAVHSTLAQSGIVKRGVFTLEQLLCEDLPDPPAAVDSLSPPPDIDPEQTSERALLQLTHSRQSACVGCHQYIDPAGFGFENFDAVGRYRTVEKNDVPIDASGVLSGIGESPLAFQNSADYARVLTRSTPMQQCVARRFLEHYLSQEIAADHCELSKYRALLSEDGHSVRGLVEALIQLESFTQRQAQ